MNDDLGFMLFAAVAVAFILFLHDAANTPVVHAKRSHHAHYAPCSTPFARQWEARPGYEDVYEAEHELCNTSYFPYCHTLSIPFWRQLDETYFDNWNEFGCARDLIPDAGCVQYLPPAEWTRGGYIYIENDKGCIEP